MDVATITMDPAEARKRASEYRRQLHRRADAEYQAAMAGYEALGRGTPLINLGDAIRGGGFDDKMRPRLAIARADRRQVYFRWNPRDPVATFDAHAQNAPRRSATLAIAVDMQREHGQVVPGYTWGATVEGYALVPLVPAGVRNRVTTPLSECFILWEVEQWADRRIGAKPDIDPYLLRHVGGDLYAVLAEWDLTPLERAVMAFRRDQ